MVRKSARQRFGMIRKALGQESARSAAGGFSSMGLKLDKTVQAAPGDVKTEARLPESAVVFIFRDRDPPKSTARAGSASSLPPRHLREPRALVHLLAHRGSHAAILPLGHPAGAGADRDPRLAGPGRGGHQD